MATSHPAIARTLTLSEQQRRAGVIDARIGADRLAYKMVHTTHNNGARPTLDRPTAVRPTSLMCAAPCTEAS
jgi:hypothetical protein